MFDQINHYFPHAETAPAGTKWSEVNFLARDCLRASLNKVKG